MIDGGQQGQARGFSAAAPARRCIRVGLGGGFGRSGGTRVADAQLRAQARKSAASAALNCAEGAARQTRADKSRAYAIALCECCEACAAIEIAGPLGACSAADVQAVVALGTRTKNILSRLVRFAVSARPSFARSKNPDHSAVADSTTDPRADAQPQST